MNSACRKRATAATLKTAGWALNANKQHCGVALELSAMRAYQQRSLQMVCMTFYTLTSTQCCL